MGIGHPLFSMKVEIFIFWKYTMVRFRVSDLGLLPKN